MIFRVLIVPSLWSNIEGRLKKDANYPSLKCPIVAPKWILICLTRAGAPFFFLCFFFPHKSFLVAALCLRPVVSTLIFFFFCPFAVGQQPYKTRVLHCARESNLPLCAMFIFTLLLPLGPERGKCIKPLTVFTCCWIDVEEPWLSTGWWWWQIDHRWMGIMGILTLPFTHWELEESIKQKVRAIGEYRHLPDRLRRAVCSGIRTSVASLVWLWGVIDSECVCTPAMLSWSALRPDGVWYDCGDRSCDCGRKLVFIIF